MDFFNEIVKITTQDSLLKLFNDTTDSKNVFSNNTDSSVTNSGVVIENEDNNKVSETSNNEGMEVNVINKETKPVRRIVYAIFAGLEYDESSSKRYRILHFEEDTIDFQFSNMEKLHVIQSDLEGIVENGRDVEGVEISIFLYELDKGFKASLRSNNYVNVSDICLLFNGGGHIRAAGCTMPYTLEESKERILAQAKRFLK